MKKKDLLKNDSGMLMLEFIIYFPIVIIAFFAFLLTALMITQRVVLDRAVATTAQSAANWVSTSMPMVGSPDPFMGGEVRIRSNPFSGMFNFFYPSNEVEFTNRVEELVIRNAGLGSLRRCSKRPTFLICN